ncbi:hypothetical protein CRE_27760 [Caenorhabditis remanei]|uniref:C2H2-type domain-containing protein n=1 Tax=Caenorhabditis remanei TaxID=31234 RepID=E3MXL5_CAERE|nr:hypothetical protein CRE_27760 [Caenorhabditis remanei]
MRQHDRSGRSLFPDSPNSKISVEVSSDGGKDKNEMSLIKQLEQISSVIVKVSFWISVVSEHTVTGSQFYRCRLLYYDSKLLLDRVTVTGFFDLCPAYPLTNLKHFKEIAAPNLPSTSTMHIKMEDGQEESGPIVIQGQGSSEDSSPGVKQKVVGVVQYVICQLCPEEEQKSMDLSNQQQMEEHFLDKHVDKEKRKCEACPSDQFQPHNIGQHYRLHTNSVYACQHCGKRGRRNYLMSHVRTHTGERPYSCDTCSKSFSDASTLRRHRLVHTGEKKYQCPVCGRAIARKDNVKVHIRSHGIHV